MINQSQTLTHLGHHQQSPSQDYINPYPITKLSLDLHSQMENCRCSIKGSTKIYLANKVLGLWGIAEGVLTNKNKQDFAQIDLSLIIDDLIGSYNAVTPSLWDHEIVK